MPRDHRVSLHDALRAAERISRFMENRALDEYKSNEMLQSAVERQFEILGESLRQLETTAPTLVRRHPVA